MKFLLLIVCASSTLPLITSGQRISKEQCKTLLKEADKCWKFAVFIGENVTVAKTPAQYQDNCKRAKTVIPCAKRLRPCLKKFPKSMLDVGLRQVKKLYSKTCENETAMYEFFKIAPCMEASMDKLYGCLNDGVKYFHHLAKKVVDDDLIPVSCCIGHKMQACTMTALKERCGPLAGEAIKQMDSMLGGFSAELLDMVCGKQKSIDECQKTLPNQMKALEEARKSSDVDIANSFILEPMLDLAERLST